MKISGRKNATPVNPLAGSQETQKPKVVEDKNAIPKTGGADNIDFSDTSKNLLKAQETVKAMPDTRIERVTEIKSALDDGEYQIESKVIAKKMVDESLNESLKRKK